MPTLWTPDPKIEEARKAKGWREFHKQAGLRNFYIDQITKAGRGYRAEAFRLNDRFKEPFIRYPLPAGIGRNPIDACLDAYRRAVEIGHCEGGLEKLFLPDDDEDLIGMADEDEDLIG